MAQSKIPASMVQKTVTAQAPYKPKVSLLNNRNKQDHIRALLCGVDKPKNTEENVPKPVSATSAYR